MEFQKLLKTTPKYIQLLKNAGITTVKDFFQYFPRAYEDRENLKTFDQLTDPLMVYSVKVKVIEKKLQFRPGGKKITDIHVQDTKGQLGNAMYMNSQFIYAALQKDQRYVMVGKPKLERGKIIFRYPEFIKSEEIDQELDMHNIGRIYPIYSELQGIKPSRFAKKMREVIDLIPQYFQEYLPKEFLHKFGLIDVPTTMRQMHYPIDYDQQKQALQRVFFDRLLRVQLYSLMNRAAYQKKVFDHRDDPVDRDCVKQLVDLLPFQLTNAQKKAVKQIVQDFHREEPMLRLMQGDVGSGKTVVAAIAARYIVKKRGSQALFLAPLQVLAHQHYLSLAKILLPLGIRIEYITGSLTKSQKDKVKADLKTGKIDIVVGTHALLQEDIVFHNLAFAVIDEQHKFGVKQRSFFKKFGSPHIIQMSATPIPRSLALAFFGEFDVTIIDELPAGRKPITTKIIAEAEMTKLKPRVMTKISQGQSVFVVTPLIEESEKMDTLKSALGEFESIKALYPELKGQIGLLHGKLKPKEKDQIMADFKSGKTKILVSTTVIEVGVDVPQATIMIIKNAERFGLSQLHQLRGRVGRSDLQSYCFLETHKKSGDTYQRLKAMEDTNDGFKLAEIDLKYRGAGEILGTRQSGETDIPIDLITDVKFIQKVQEGAHWLLEKYPDLEGLPALQHQVAEKLGSLMV